ncbi:TPA: polysaccharide pyruvyl transferase family protein [Streptococcus suis]
MKKVGIMSMQRIANYGSFLQAYALRKLLEKEGCSVEFVDYHVDKPVIVNDERNQFVRKFNKVIEVIELRASLGQKVSYLKHKQSFFKKYLPLLGVSELMNYNPPLDCLIVGSDEVFNCIQKNPNVGYSLELFGKDNNAKRLISYAASFGNTTLDKLQAYAKDREISTYLKRFDAISVRDSNSGEIVKKLTGKEPIYNLDPVLTYDYMNECDEVPQFSIEEKYLILYAYPGRISDEEAKWISIYAKEKGLKIYTIGGIQKYADRFIDCSPFEVLAYFKNASEVITDTFHGSIFSIITHRPFVTLVRQSIGTSYGNEEKLMDLLRRLQLESQATYDIKESRKILNTTIDYYKTDELITNYRDVAVSYLKNNLNTIKKENR